MARQKSMIYADVEPITGGGTEADMMCWVRVTEMLIRAREKREARLATAAVEDKKTTTNTPTQPPSDV